MNGTAWPALTLTGFSCRQVLGVHVVGPESAEIIQGIAIAMKCAAGFPATLARMQYAMGRGHPHVTCRTSVGPTRAICHVYVLPCCTDDAIIAAG